MSLFNKDISVTLPDKIDKLRTYFFYYGESKRKMFKLTHLRTYAEDNLFQRLLESKPPFKYDEITKIKRDYILALINTNYKDIQFDADDKLFINIKNDKELREYMNILLNSNLNPKELFNRSEKIKINKLFKKVILKTLLEVLGLNYEVKDISKIFRIDSYINNIGHYEFILGYKEFCINKKINPSDIVFYVTIYYI